MYTFRDTVAEGWIEDILPSEALQINGDYIETLIDGYRTLYTSGREALSQELESIETGVRDGSKLKSRRYPARIITIGYQLIAKSNEEFREAYNKLASILNVQDAELIFNDEPDKFFTGTPSRIRAVDPGTNAVQGEFEITCYDPFKYSVQEYEAEPWHDDKTFLINYNGTYKAYPTLEAEFFSEDESKLTGNGDCGYVAFFNEHEKIIQLGDPGETDTEDYAKSQTLVSSKFNKETAWGTLAQSNWATNGGKLFSDGFKQSGSVAVDIASWLTTNAPVTSGALLAKTSKAAKPYIDYKVTAKTTARTADSVSVKVTVDTVMQCQKNSSTVQIKAGAKVKLSGVKKYVSSDASASNGTISGTYYLWDASVKNGRIRITNAASRVGKSGQVTCWVRTADLGLSESTTSTALGSKIVIRGAIKFGTQDWNYIEIKRSGTSWKDNSTHTASITVKVNDTDADVTALTDIRFKVDRTDDEAGDAAKLDETACKDFEISTYTAPVPDTWYLSAETLGTSSGWHGPSITRAIPDDAAGDAGAKNFTFSWRQKMAIGSGNTATQEYGEFEALLISGSGDSRKILAGVSISKDAAGKSATLRFIVNGKTKEMRTIDLSFNNKYFGNNSTSKGITTVKTSTITKVGKKVEFNIGGIKRTFTDSAISSTKATAMTFYFAGYGTKPVLSYNGLYWAKFVKNNCDTWEDIPNKFGTDDIVTADCKSGSVYLNDVSAPALGALGNDWEDFYLLPGLNQISTAYSDWVSADYAPKFKIKYREVFI